MLPAFANVVRANLRKVRTLEVPFYFATVPVAKRNVFFVGFRPGKVALFSSLTKIGTHLRTRGRGELILPKTAKYCAGVVVRRDGQLVFTVHIKKGVSEAVLGRMLPRMNRLDKLNLGDFVLQSLVQEKHRLASLKRERADKNSPPSRPLPRRPRPFSDDAETLDTPDTNPDVEDDTPDTDTNPPDVADDTIDPPDPPDTPVRHQPPSPPPSRRPSPASARASRPARPPATKKPFPDADDLIRLREKMVARIAGLQPGDEGQYGYFLRAHDQNPLLVLSRPGSPLPEPMQKAGAALTQQGRYRQFPEGLTLDGPPFQVPGLTLQFVPGF